MLRHLPNAICLLRIALTVPTVQAIASAEYVDALTLFAIAALSDGIDGYLAKRFGWTSNLGRILDPLADKILLVAAFVACTWAGLVPVWLAATAIARDVMLVGGAIIFRLWFGPIEGHPTLVSKANTTLQIIVVVVALLNATAPFVPAALAFGLTLVTLVTTVISGVGYIGRSMRAAWTLPPTTRSSS